VDPHTLAEVNARLSRAREAFHEALILEQETLARCGNVPDGSPGRKPVQMAHERVMQTAEAYEEAVEAFSNFRIRRFSAAG